MADRRMISSTYWENESIATLTIQQRLLFLGLISNADDQGRLKGNPGLVRRAVFPLDDIPLETIRVDLEAIAAIGSILLYDVDGRQYIQVAGWWKHQHPQWGWPSKIPAPPGWSDCLRYKDGSGKTIEINWKTKSKQKSADQPLDENRGSAERLCDGSAEPLPAVSGESSDGPSPETAGKPLGLGIGSDIGIELEKDPPAHLELSDSSSEGGVPAASPPDPPPSASDPYPNPKPPLSPGQSALLQAFGAKRFKTDAQRQTVLDLEQLYGSALLQEAILWAAKKGMRLNDAVPAIETALPKWRQPKPNTASPPLPTITPEQREQEAQRSRALRLNAKPVEH